MNNKKTYIIIILIFVALFIIIAFLPFIVSQNKYLSYKIDGKIITKIEYARYSSKPFTSAIIEEGSIYASIYEREDDKEISEEQEENDKIIKEFHSSLVKPEIDVYKKHEAVNEVLFIYFDDGTMINAYIDGDYLGFNYGDMWIKDIRISELMNKITTVKLIQEVK